MRGALGIDSTDRIQETSMRQALLFAALFGLSIGTLWSVNAEAG